LGAALQAYLKIESRGIQDTDVRRALDASSAAGKVVEERYMAIRENGPALRVFEEQLSRVLLAAGYDYTGFRKFGENDYTLTFEYRGGR
jgi:predicted transcriptional regulator